MNSTKNISSNKKVYILFLSNNGVINWFEEEKDAYYEKGRLSALMDDAEMKELGVLKITVGRLKRLIGR